MMPVDNNHNSIIITRLHNCYRNI